MNPRQKMRSNRDTDRDWKIVNALRDYDAPITASELQALLPDITHVSSVITDIAIKFDYPVWRLRGTKAGSTATKYVYSDTKPANAVRKFPDMTPSAGKLQNYLDIDLTEDANRRAREARAVSRAAASPPPKVAMATTPPVLPGIVADAVEKFAGAQVFELLEERDEDVILFKFKGRVFFGKPVRI